MAIDTRGKEMRNIRKTLQPRDDENQIISDCEQKASAFFFSASLRSNYVLLNGAFQMSLFATPQRCAFIKPTLSHILSSFNFSNVISLHQKNAKKYKKHFHVKQIM